MDNQQASRRSNDNVTPQYLSRRTLTRLLVAGAGLAAIGNLLAACGGATAPATAVPASAPTTAAPVQAPTTAAPSAPTTTAAPTTAAPGQAPTSAASSAPPTTAAGGAATTVRFEGWDYEPPLVEQNIKRFETLNPNIKVQYTPITGSQYREKLVAEFTAKTNPDGLYVRDDYFAGWVTAGYLQPIDGMPGVDKVYQMLYGFNADAMTYKGKRYGLPYYTDCMAFVYNEEMLQKAGFTAPPKSLQELEDQAVKIKSMGIVQNPMSMNLGLTNDFWTDWWALIYASGAKLFDDKMNPIMDQPNSIPGQVMTWINRGINDTKIIDQASLSTSNNARDNFMAGQHAFVFIARYDIEAVNNPQRSKVAGKAKMALLPSIDGVNKGSVGWTRQYCLTANTKVKDAAFKLNYYLGGLDETGQPYTAKFWFLQRGLGFAYKELANDSEIQTKLKKFVDPAIYSKQAENARVREAIMEAWYSEWESGNQKLMQQVYTKQISVADALKGMAANAKKLKQQNS